jgi:hypothetical protein
MSFHVFTRRWWKNAEVKGVWPRELEPEAGPKLTLTHVSSEDEARKVCREYNTTHVPGRYSVKAEYEHGYRR